MMVVADDDYEVEDEQRWSRESRTARLSVYSTSSLFRILLFVPPSPVVVSRIQTV